MADLCALCNQTTGQIEVDFHKLVEMYGECFAPQQVGVIALIYLHQGHEDATMAFLKAADTFFSKNYEGMADLESTLLWQLQKERDPEQPIVAHPDHQTFVGFLVFLFMIVLGNAAAHFVVKIWLGRGSDTLYMCIIRPILRYLLMAFDGFVGAFTQMIAPADTSGNSLWLGITGLLPCHNVAECVAADGLPLTNIST